MTAKIKIGITGSDGNVGSALRIAFTDQYDLRLFTLDTVDYESIIADLSKADQVQGIFDGLDCIIHLAADISARSPWESILPNNIIATQNLFTEAIRAGVKKIVFASTNHVQHGYYMEDGLPHVTDASITRKHKIDDPPFPDSIYGVSKLFGENLGRYYSKAAGIQFIALRIGWIPPYSDDPACKDGTEQESHLRALYLSKRDCIHAFKRAIEVKTDFLVAYATSDNRQFGIFDLEESKRKLGYNPQDSSDRE
ncbi:MAG: NAD+ dependent glucose-6-phosphate dehydrogenase [Candidatus Pelagisphaera sp.]|jgi:NAD+ dependent glucose-6-phosphate dehydrogenase